MQAMISTLKIRVKDRAEPMAFHQPIPLPHHRHQKVPEGLKRDCRLAGVSKCLKKVQMSGKTFGQ